MVGGEGARDSLESLAGDFRAGVKLWSPCGAAVACGPSALDVSLSMLRGLRDAHAACSCRATRPVAPSPTRLGRLALSLDAASSRGA